MDSGAYEQRLINDMLMRRALHGQGESRHCTRFSAMGPSGLARCARYAPGAGLYEYGGARHCDSRYKPPTYSSGKCKRTVMSGKKKSAKNKQPKGLKAYQKCIHNIMETKNIGREDARKIYNNMKGDVYQCNF